MGKKEKTIIKDRFDPENHIVLFPGSCLDLLSDVPDSSISLVVTSPPYNLGKEYEKRLDLNRYIQEQSVGNLKFKAN